MFRFNSMRSVPTEYYILQNFRTEGPVAGHLAGRPIPGTIVDHSGKRYHYVGLATRRDGRFDVLSLQPGEWIVEPGLIYASDDADG